MIRILLLLLLLLLLTFLSSQEGMVEKEIVLLYEEVHSRIKGNQTSLNEIEKQVGRFLE